MHTLLTIHPAMAHAAALINAKLHAHVMIHAQVPAAIADAIAANKQD